MSEEIANREYRQKVIRDLIAQLHEGKSVEEVKGFFEAAFQGVSAEEISQAEQALIEGGLPVTEVQRLCDVHAAVFKGSIEDIHRPQDPSSIPGHPAEVLKRENKAIKALCDRLGTESDPARIPALLDRLSDIDRHYLKKENLLFPLMERYGITAPPKVMWGVDDEIRALLKEAKTDAKGGRLTRETLEGLLSKVTEMIFKEENILLPMLLENLTPDEWKTVHEGSAEFGLCLLDSIPAWEPQGEPGVQAVVAQEVPGVLSLPTGSFTVEQLKFVLNTLPVDITFVDKDDTVKYFSEAKERIFPRTKAIIGRKVSNCHPPASVHIVEQLVEDFKANKKDHEDFWIPMGEKFVFIRYFAVRNDRGDYLGTLEVTQNIAPIKELTGEKRLVSE